MSIQFGGRKMEFSEKIIAFIDILGWKALVENAEAGSGFPLADLLRLLDCFGTGLEREGFEKTGPKCCPHARYQSRNLDFRLSQISDCAIVSAEVSPAGVINLLWHCWRAVFQLLEHGIMCRGYVKLGRIYHTEKYFIGSGYQGAFAAEGKVDAFKREANERGTPFVQIDTGVTGFVAECGDACVKTMFARMVKVQGDTVALFPFQRLQQRFIVSAPGYTFDAEKQRRSNANLRRRIQRYREQVESQIDESNAGAVAKSRHYLAALDDQLVICEETDRVIDGLESRAEAP